MLVFCGENKEICSFFVRKFKNACFCVKNTQIWCKYVWILIFTHEMFEFLVRVSWLHQFCTTTCVRTTCRTRRPHAGNGMRACKTPVAVRGRARRRVKVALREAVCARTLHAFCRISTPASENRAAGGLGCEECALQAHNHNIRSAEILLPYHTEWKKAAFHSVIN